MNREIPAAFDALGCATRRAIIHRLATGPAAVGEIAAALPVSRPAVSKHLRLLQRARLVRHRCEGSRHVFELERTGFDAARGWLDAFWDEALGNFARLADVPSEDER
jgi:DNA-binding transcriptional ArsR family regulator